MTNDEVMKELLVVQRERAVVKAARISDALKQRMFVALDARLASLESALGGTGGEAPGSAGQAVVASGATSRKG